MRRTRLAAAIAAIGIATGAAACGGEETVVTVTTDTAATSGEPPSTATTSTTLTPPATETSSTAPDTAGPELSLLERMPPADAYPGVNAGEAESIPTAIGMTERLYASGDPARIPAADALDEAGYAGGYLRDDRGQDPATGLALFRSYVFELGAAEDAVEQTNDSADEVLRTTALDTDTFDVPDIPDARGVVASGSQAGTDLAVAFIVFPAGSYVYGLQAVAGSESGIDLDRLQSIAAAQYEQALGG